MAPASPASSKAPSIITKLAKKFGRKSDAAFEDPDDPAILPASSSRSTRSSRRAQPLPSVDVSMPRLRPPSDVSSPFDVVDSPSTHPPSVYAAAPVGPSAQSIRTYSSSYSSLVPDTADYNYEFERLQLEYRSSQERLRLEQAHNDAQARLFERERLETSVRHERELENLRRQILPDGGKGKQRRL
jgi:hypothetical protein